MNPAEIVMQGMARNSMLKVFHLLLENPLVNLVNRRIDIRIVGFDFQTVPLPKCLLAFTHSAWLNA